MLRKLIADHSPEYIAASFDLAGPTFRDDLAADYKANRAPMPSDLAEQMPLVHEACEALGVPVLTSERFEADDVIGTLATQAQAAGLRRRDRHGRQGLLSARRRRHPRLQPARRRHVVRRGRRRREVRRAARSGRRRAGADGRQHRQHQGRAGHRREGRARADRDARHRSTRCSRPRRRSTQKRYREALLAHADDARQSRELARIRTTCR